MYPIVGSMGLGLLGFLGFLGFRVLGVESVIYMYIYRSI